MKRKRLLFNVLLTFSIFVNAQQSDSIYLKEVVIQEKIPITQQKITQKYISEVHFGKDIPLILEQSMSVISTSDAGNGVGYTGIRIRGVDATRINITLNGVPINDSESQNVFWVNMPDLASSLSNISVQRGIGASTSGTASFGAAVHMKTQNPDEMFSGNLSSIIGSFGTHKTNFSIHSGEISKNLFATIGASLLSSDGYIDRASSDLYSYFLQMKLAQKSSSFNLLHFSGNEKTYQAWYGIDAATLQQNRTLNYAGAIYDASGNIVDYYNNQTDNYSQNHTHFTWNIRGNNSWSLRTTLHYTKGKGYYEEYKQSEFIDDYFLTNTNQTADLIRRKWLNNHFFGITSEISYRLGSHFLSGNITANTYLGNHFGHVISLQNAMILPDFPFEYYRSLSEKNEISSYIKWLYQVDKISLFADFQVRNIHYSSEIKQHSDLEGDVSFGKKYLFWNPKIGLNYEIKDGKWYTSFALAQREPTRTDIVENKDIKSELLFDVELGFQKKYKNWQFASNVYGMFYKNQLIQSGTLDDVGNPIKENAAKSYRIGWETELSYQWNSTLYKLQSTVSNNRNINYFDSGNTTTAFSPNVIQNFAIQHQFSDFFSILSQNKFVSSQYLSNRNESNSKLNDYFQSDLFLSFSLEKIVHTKLIFRLAVYNLWNENIVNNGYYYDNSLYYYPQAFRNYMFQFTWKF